MKTTQRIVISTAALAIFAVSGCVDAPTTGPQPESTEVQKQAVTVVPEFMITGADAMPDTLHVTELGLVVSEVRLEPMSTATSVAYSTRDAMLVEFDIANGESVRTTESLEIPSPGRYLVSIRLEPVDTFEETSGASFNMYGFVSGDHDTTSDDDDMDGRPQPMPFDSDGTTDRSEELTDVQAYPTAWTPFEYHSKRAVFYTFNDVMLEPGEQFLTFSFDVRDWAIEVVEPISNAVRANETDADSVDVTKQVDSTGYGVEALIETGVVRSDRRPAGQ